MILTHKTRFLAVLAAITVLAPYAAGNGLLIDVNVGATAQGSAELVEPSAGFPQQVAVTWYNSGSVGCPVQARVQFYNGSNRVYTGWSTSADLWPGQFMELDMAAPLPASTYQYQIDVFHCQQPFHVENGTISSTGPAQDDNSNNSIRVLGQYASEDTVTAYVTADTRVKNVSVVPLDRPAGWRVPSVQIGTVTPGVQRIELPYTPSIWKPATIETAFVTDHGRIIDQVTFRTAKKQDHKLWKRIRLHYLQLRTSAPFL